MNKRDKGAFLPLTLEMGSWRWLRKRPRQLSLRFPAHRFHCIDLPGNGSRYRETSPSTIAGIRQQVLQYASHIPGPLGLIGLSMGAMVALDWAQADSDRVVRLVLINTSTGFSPPWHRMRPLAFGQALAMALRRNVEERERSILRLTSNRTVGQALEASWPLRIHPDAGHDLPLDAPDWVLEQFRTVA